MNKEKDGRGFKYFITLTFDKEVSPSTGKKILGRFITRLNEREYGKHYYRGDEGLVVYVAEERHAERPVIHYHGLICKECPLLTAKYCEDAWKKVGGGFSLIRSYDPNRHAVEYISKYVRFGGEIDVYFPKGYKFGN